MGKECTNRRWRARIGRESFVAAILAPTLLLAACGSSGQPQQSATSPTSAPPSSSVVAPTTGSLSASTLSASTLSASTLSGAAPTTLQGTVTEGVESGCVVLVDASGAVLANLRDWDLRAHPFDSQVEVTGAFEPDMMTTCQQGTPFEAVTVVSR